MNDEKEYSILTIKNYERNLKNLEKFYVNNFKKKFIIPDCLIEESDIIVENLLKKYKKGTVVNYIKSIIWSLRRGEYSQKSQGEYSQNDILGIEVIWQNHLHVLKEDINEEEIKLENRLTEKEEKTFIKWESVIELYSKLTRNFTLDSHPNEVLDYVIVSLYVLHPPLRADYANMHLFVDESDIPEGLEENYCVLQTNPRFMLYHYKTFKTYGPQCIPIADNLHKVLLQWASINNSGYLISTYSKSANEFHVLNENALTKRVISIFGKHCGINASINTLRHSFVSYVAKNDQALKDKQHNANMMLHSTSMADNYRKMVYIE